MFAHLRINVAIQVVTPVDLVPGEAAATRISLIFKAVLRIMEESAVDLLCVARADGPGALGSK